MTTLQIVGLVAVLVGGTAVVLTPDALRQTIVLGVYGIALTFLFFTFQAPDVALSEIVVTGLGLPLIVLAALRKIHQQAEGQESSSSGEPGADEGPREGGPG